ncbi:MAG: thioredoxin domain-containing protein [Gemmataceae bacterium]|nr:thioredoxin domain-containing protein [Gemmataceae bacterium]
MSSPNRLAAESSLYLRQHANNPVDWYPWGPEAIAHARTLDRPIFLSIGYSACHWCHVMERESFESEAIATILNEHFVCIKVDREERPDIDDIYMKSVQLLNHGQGGWPMSVWLTPDLKPFYAGTYFPPDDRYGRPGFPRLLVALAQAWRDRRDDLVRTSGDITDHLREFVKSPSSEATLHGPILPIAAQQIAKHFEPRYGGFGSAPKFPHALDLSVMLRYWKRTGDGQAMTIVRTTLDHMARGGIYDQLGGGFHRYSVDAKWLIPHFEKMLYDNALLSAVYMEAHQATGEPFYRQIAEETLDYVRREMTSPTGGFYSTQDADSEGEEGKFFVWSLNEVRSVLGPDADYAAETWGITESGNFEGHTILTRSSTLPDDDRYRAVRHRLWQAREPRVKPGRDEKMIAAWNGLMIAAFARIGSALDRGDYTTAAVRAAEFVESRLVAPDGRLMRTCGDNIAARIPGFLEDYAAIALAYSHLFDATLDERWLTRASELLRTITALFADPTGGYFSTPAEQADLIFRPKDVHDGSTPSGNALAATAFIRVGHQAGDVGLLHQGRAVLSSLRGTMEAHPTTCGQLLIASDLAEGPVQEVTIVGDATHEHYRTVLCEARAAFSPNRVFASASGRPAQGPMTLYLCENATCREPVCDPAAAVKMLRADES